jgi:cytochrome c biogenesis protein CcmG/thiol:disulfide interchange protein DsbE
VTHLEPPTLQEAKMADQESSDTLDPRPRANLARRLPLVVGLVILALLVYGLLSSRQGGRPQPGEPAPDWSLTLLDGSEVALADLGGQIVVLNFWASWCAPCRREAAGLQSVWESYQDRGVVFVGVTYRDARDASLAFIEEYGITYTNGVDEMGRISDAYGVTAVPETFIIDRQGRLNWLKIGEVQAAELTRRLEQALE